MIDLDNEEMFNYLTSFNLGRFDSPGIFAINGSAFNEKIFYRNYHTYYSTVDINFNNISGQFVSEIRTGVKLPLYARW